MKHHIKNLTREQYLTEGYSWKLDDMWGNLASAQDYRSYMHAKVELKILEKKNFINRNEMCIVVNARNTEADIKIISIFGGLQ